MRTDICEAQQFAVRDVIPLDSLRREDKGDSHETIDILSLDCRNDSDYKNRGQLPIKSQDSV